MRVTHVMLGRVSRESEISLGEKSPKGADFGLSLNDPISCLAKAKQGWGISRTVFGQHSRAKVLTKTIALRALGIAEMDSPASN